MTTPTTTPTPTAAPSDRVDRPAPETMRAVKADRYGSPGDVLRLQ